MAWGIFSQTSIFLQRGGGGGKSGVTTEIFSAALHTNGYRNRTMPIATSSPVALKFISKGKNYTIGKKLTWAKSLKEAHAQCAGQQSHQSAQCAKCMTV
jgi:hypothetical protein